MHHPGPELWRYMQHVWPSQRNRATLLLACTAPTGTAVQVATRRTRTAGKVEIPNVDDHVSKLEHMGKETVKKLQDLRGAAIQVGLDINVPDNCINKGARAHAQPPRATACTWSAGQRTRVGWRCGA